MKVGILGAGHIAAKMGRTLMEMSRSGAGDLKELCYCETRELPHSEILSAMRIMDSLLADWGVRLG